MAILGLIPRFKAVLINADLVIHFHCDKQISLVHHVINAVSVYVQQFCHVAHRKGCVQQLLRCRVLSFLIMGLSLIPRLKVFFLNASLPIDLERLKGCMVLYQLIDGARVQPEDVSRLRDGQRRRE